MSAFTFNISLGREVELYNRVDSNDPANSRLIMMVLAESGLESDGVLRTYDTFAAILAASNNEVTNGSYARKTFTDAGLSAFTVDDVNNKIVLSLAAQSFATIAAGDSWRKVVIGYEPDSTAPADSAIVPMVAGDVLINGVAVVPDGTNIQIDYSGGFVTAR